MSVEQDREFLSRVVPWPAEGEPGFINIHWRRPAFGDPTKLFWSGKPTLTLTEFCQQVSWGLTQDSVKDIFFCLSRQSTAGKTKNGYPAPVRNADNALLTKALWIDIDVKEPPKGYATTADALAALMQFCAAHNLPRPSAVVASGSGGIHVYWISKTPLTVAQWEPYANGLKAAALQFGLRCDAGCTSDVARVLRVPNTKNYKTTPPKPTALLGILPREQDYDFEQVFSHLTGLAPPVTAGASGNRAAPFDLTPFPKRNRVVGESLADGIWDKTPVPWEPVAQQCGFIGQALASGGKSYTQPLWNLTTLAATFMESGHALAHKMGDEHPGYSRESTEALWDRKQRERKDSGLGWPSCRTIKGEGCTACNTCPHFNAGKSPLNLAPSKPKPQAYVAPVTATVTVPTFVAPAIIALNMPTMLLVDAHGLLCGKSKF